MNKLIASGGGGGAYQLVFTNYLKEVNHNSSNGKDEHQHRNKRLSGTDL